MLNKSNLYINKQFSLYNGKMQINSQKNGILFTDSASSFAYSQETVIKSIFESYSHQANTLVKTALRISKHPQLQLEPMVKIVLPLLERIINAQGVIPSYFSEHAKDITIKNNQGLRDFLFLHKNKFITHVFSGNSPVVYLEWILENIQQWVASEAQIYIIQAVEYQTQTLDTFAPLVNKYEQVKTESPTASLYFQAIFDDGDLYTAPIDAQDLDEQFSRSIFDTYTEINCKVNRVLCNWPEWGNIQENQVPEILNFIPMHNQMSPYAQKLGQFRNLYANIYDWNLKGYFDILRLLTSGKEWTEDECARLADNLRNNANNYDRPTNVITLLLAEMALNNIYEKKMYPGLSPYVPHDITRFKFDMANILFPFLTLAFFQEENNEVYFLVDNPITSNIFSDFDMTMQRDGDDYYLSIESIHRGKNKYLSILRKENKHILIPHELVARGYAVKERYI